MILDGKALAYRGRRVNPTPFVRLLLLLILLYAFFVSISLLGASFKFFGKGFAERLLTMTSNPFTGLFIGILATSLVQSSSTITSMVVGLVAGGALSVSGAIPIVIGSNIGTSVTNTLVSVGHISRPAEFRRAFAAATIHDFFNLISVLIIFPLQLATNFLGSASSFMARQLEESGGLELINPLKTIVSPSVKLIIKLTGESGVLMLIIAVVLLFVALRFIVVNLRALVIGKIERFFDKTLFRNAFTALLLGLVVTVMVQSSSITTSLTVPLAAASILTLRQIFPFALGANVGTTITAILASLVTSDQAAVTVAFAHLLFNVTGIILIWPIKRVPLYLSETLAAASIKSRLVPIVYILVVFFLIPIVLIYFAR
ncbi:MAG: Na/Pi symporter [Candidatus Latescibacterota bacterium]|nr:MAG: Na/Pi symporter [Candidatus Latescibacterota bacterium]